MFSNNNARDSKRAINWRQTAAIVALCALTFFAGMGYGRSNDTASAEGVTLDSLQKQINELRTGHDNLADNLITVRAAIQGISEKLDNQALSGDAVDTSRPGEADDVADSNSLLRNTDNREVDHSLSQLHYLPPTPTPTPTPVVVATPVFSRPSAYPTPTPYILRAPSVAENGSYYGEISEATGRPKTVHVEGYYRRDGTYVRGHYRSAPRRR